MSDLMMIPLLLRIATAFYRCLNGGGNAVDYTTLIDGIVELARKVPKIASLLPTLQPWIEKLKQVLPTFTGGTAAQPATALPTGFGAADLSAAVVVTRVYDDVMARMIAEGLAAQNAIQTDDDVIDNV